MIIEDFPGSMCLNWFVSVKLDILWFLFNQHFALHVVAHEVNDFLRNIASVMVISIIFVFNRNLIFLLELLWTSGGHLFASFLIVGFKMLVDIVKCNWTKIMTGAYCLVLQYLMYCNELCYLTTLCVTSLVICDGKF